MPVGKGIGKPFRKQKSKGDYYMKKENYTVVGTNIDEVKRLNSESGLTYNEMNELLTKEIEQRKKSNTDKHKE
ncbi:hypothetical protein [Sporosarcina sp. GW1-11]|uniref:hypothetical protein n=1 Tax=Sporosarcina sp. GW1-11 TaxID=2899126 RepID=UPI0029554A8E|nr:hypothetical protein [Sporosarcina sp. GW1-11]